jgi:hypothetical protein
MKTLSLSSPAGTRPALSSKINRFLWPKAIDATLVDGTDSIASKVFVREGRMGNGDSSTCS